MPNASDSSSEQFYYADGKKIPLVPSPHFIALPADSGDAVANVSERVAAQSADVNQPVKVLDLTDFNLVVLQVPDTGAAPSARAAAAGVSDAGSGPQVYETLAQPAGPAPEALIAIGEILLRFTAEATAAAQDKLMRKYRLKVVRADYPEPGTLLVSSASGAANTVQIANELHEDENVEYAVPNFVRINARLQSPADVVVGDEPALAALVPAQDAADTADGAAPTWTPNDPALASQWGLHKIRAPEAWDISRGSPSISIAIIDEGGAAHEDYVLAPGWDARFNDSDPTPNPTDGHGTACAGIAAATANNGLGGAGVAPGCKIRHIRIAYGVGGGAWSTTDAIVADGVRRAVNLGADVLSNSFRVGPSTAVTNAYNYAQASGRGGKGAVIAAATANDDVLGVAYPAKLSPTIRGFLAVGASNQWDQRKSKTSLDGETWWGSNYGPEVDVVAPGVKIYTTDIMAAGGYGAGNYTPAFNGTSSATPHVAGLMGLILSVDPDLTSWEVEDIIKQTVKDLGPAGRDNEYGFGRIDARAALEAASRLWYDVAVTPVFLGSGHECFIRVNIRMYNPGINTVRLNNLVFRSHTPTGGVIEQFDFVGNPGPVLQPRSGHDVRFTGLLLRANGTQASWSHRWSVDWGYTYWRPGVPAFPLDTAPPVDGLFVLDETLGQRSSATVQGRDSGTQSAAAGVYLAAAARANGQPAASSDPTGDSITVDRASRAITIVVR